MIDATIVPVHRHGHGAKMGLKGLAIGKSKGRWITKILALADVLGNLVRFERFAGQPYDAVGAAPLIEGVKFDAARAGKTFSSNRIIEEMNECGAQIVISQRPQCKRAAGNRQGNLQMATFRREFLSQT